MANFNDLFPTQNDSKNDFRNTFLNSVNGTYGSDFSDMLGFLIDSSQNSMGAFNINDLFADGAQQQDFFRELLIQLMNNSLERNNFLFQSEYNSPLNAAARMRAAGLNPDLLGVSGGQTNAGLSTSAIQGGNIPSSEQVKAIKNQVTTNVISSVVAIAGVISSMFTAGASLLATAASIPNIKLTGDNLRKQGALLDSSAKGQALSNASLTAGLSDSLSQNYDPYELNVDDVSAIFGVGSDAATAILASARKSYKSKTQPKAVTRSIARDTADALAADVESRQSKAILTTDDATGYIQTDFENFVENRMRNYEVELKRLDSLFSEYDYNDRYFKALNPTVAAENQNAMNHYSQVYFSFLAPDIAARSQNKLNLFQGNQAFVNNDILLGTDYKTKLSLDNAQVKSTLERFNFREQYRKHLEKKIMQTYQHDKWFNKSFLETALSPTQLRLQYMKLYNALYIEGGAFDSSLSGPDLGTGVIGKMLFNQPQ